MPEPSPRSRLRATLVMLLALTALAVAGVRVLNVVRDHQEVSPSAAAP